jgi:non-ribosomal peptide synthetase component F/NRPS condensation-like uncharacterized protein/acyl carrier protein
MVGALDYDALRQTFDEIVRRHEVLRTCFPAREGKPSQQITTKQRAKFKRIDLSDLAEGERAAKAREFAVREMLTPFNVRQGPLLRIKLLRLAEQEHVLLLTMHHIISDGWSIRVLMREVSALYQAFVSGKPSPLPELAIQYADYSAWQRSWLAGEVLEGQLKYWKRQLGGVAVLDLPTDHERPKIPTQRGSSFAVRLPAELTRKVKELSQREGVTLYMTLLAAYQTLLHRYSGQADIAVGTPIAGRMRKETENLIGFFVNTLVMRTKLGGNPGFREVLRQVKEATLGAYAHQDVPFEKLVDELQPDRSSGRTPLFQVMFALQNAPVSALDLGATKLEPFRIQSTTAKFEFVFSLGEVGEELVGVMEYNTDLYERETAEGMMERYEELLRGVVEDSGRGIEEYGVLSGEEREEMKRGYWVGVEKGGREEEGGRFKSVMEKVRGWAEKDGGAREALVTEGRVVSYGELEGESNRLGRYLRRKMGLKRGDRVGLREGGGWETMVGVLGVLKAGGVVVPVEREEGMERVKRMAEDAGMRMMVAGGEWKREQEGLAEFGGVEWVVVGGGAGREGEGEEGWRKESEEVVEGMEEVEEEEEAMVLYRSGGSGRPEGIKVGHGWLVGERFEKEAGGLDGGERVGMKVSFGGESGCVESLRALSVGACVVDVGGGVGESPRKLAKVVKEERVEVLWTSGGMVERLGREFPWALKKVKWVVCEEGMEEMAGLGERVSGEVLERVMGCYGGSEVGGGRVRYGVKGLGDGASGVGVVVVEMEHVGKGTRVYLLDEGMEPVGEGMVGEIYIGGEGMGLGYEGRGGRTAERYVPDPWSGGSGGSGGGRRLYRTGDRGRRRRDGKVEYRGRVDRRVMVGGRRVEGEEIEGQLREHSGLKEAVVTVRGEVVGQEEKLAVWAVGVEGAGVVGAEVREYLREKLGEGMVPERVTMVGEIARNEDGEGGVDYGALGRLLRGGGEAEYVAPGNEVEERVAEIWRETLGLERVGVKDNFFQVGGHSLLATQVVARMSSGFGVEIALRRLFESPTIAELAVIVQKQVADAEAAGERKAEEAPMVRVSREGVLPPSYAQQRLWFLDQLVPGSASYNIVGALRVSGPLDKGALNQSLQELVRRHEVIRTRLEAEQGEPRQVITGELRLGLPEIDLSGLEEEGREAETMRLVQEEAATGFDLKNGPLLRVKLLKQGEFEHVLVVNMHHVISDGWSVGVLVREVSALYQAFVSGKPSPLPELAIQYADYSAWQRSWLAGEVLEGQLKYWKRQLGGVAVLDLPTDHERPKIPTQRGSSFAVRLPAELTRKVKELSQREGVTLYMTLLAAYQTLLHRYSGQADIAVGTPIAGRMRKETENLIGFFVNTLVMRTKLGGNPGFREVLRQVKEATLGAYAHQDVPFEKLVDELQPDRSSGRTPLFQVMFALQNAPVSALDLGATKLEPFRIQSTTAKFEFVFSLGEVGEELVGVMEYNTDLYERETAEGMMERYEELLRGVVEDSGRGIEEYGVLSGEEREEMKRGYWVGVEKGGREEEGGRFKSVMEKVRGWAEKDGGAREALVTEGRVVSYGELEGESNRLGRYLRRKMGLKRGDRVGLREGGGWETMVGVLGVLKAGGVVVPVEREEGMERVKRMAEDAGMRMMVAGGEWKREQEGLAEFGGVEWVVVGGGAGREGEGEEGWRKESEEVVEGMEEVEEEEEAMVLYRSGGSGRPEGIKVGHGWLVGERFEKEAGGLDGGERVGMKVSFGGESGCVESLRALSVGACVVDVGGGVGESPRKLAKVVKEERVEVLWTSGGMVERLGREFPWALKKVKWVVCEEGMEEMAGLGERVSGEVLERVMGCYGGSEVGGGRVRYGVKGLGDGASGVGVVVVEMEHVGKGTRVYLLDEGMEPVGEGMVGEIYIGGEGMGLGYEGRGGRTAERYVPDPWSGGSGGSGGGRRLYRTGDRGRRRRDGKVEYRGRVDRRVMVGGRRVEGEEIEGQLREHSGLKEAVVTVRGEVVGQEEKLAVWAVGVEGAGVVGAEVREYLREKLGEGMVPERVTMVGEIARNEDGEGGVDYGALGRLLRGGGEAEYVAPGNEVEERVAEIWRETLGLERVGVKDNFFQVGGHSLLATQVVARMSSGFGVEIALRRLFESPTIAGLAAIVERSIEDLEVNGKVSAAPAPIRRVAREAVVMSS